MNKGEMAAGKYSRPIRRIWVTITTQWRSHHLNPPVKRHLWCRHGNLRQGAQTR